MPKYTVRLAEEKDSKEILEIYSYYILKTTATFEYTVPTYDEFTRRIAQIKLQFPYIVCEWEGKIIGYAYASKHMERAAYSWNATMSVYIDKDHHRKGIGRALYQCIYEILSKQGYYNLYATITKPNEKSEAFHIAEGFKPIGTFQYTGYKFDTWLDVLWMGKAINSHSLNPKPVLPISAIKKDFLEDLFNIKSKLLY